MVTKEEFNKLNEIQKKHLVESFALQLEVKIEKLLDGKKLPTYRKLKRYCLNIINKKEINKGEE